MLYSSVFNVSVVFFGFLVFEKKIIFLSSCEMEEASKPKGKVTKKMEPFGGGEGGL